MNTKVVMSGSAFFLALIGIGFTFFGAEIAVFTGTGLSKTFQLILQLLGALYFAFAMLNWMAKGITMGGIYNRPIAIANFTHFLMGSLALIKAVVSNPGLSYGIWGLAAVYAFFALVFGWILYRNPANKLAVANS